MIGLSKTGIVGGFKQHPGAVEKCRARTHSNQGIHIGRAHHEGLQASRKEHPVEEEGRKRQKELQDAAHEPGRVGPQPIGGRESHHGSHAHVHEKNKGDDRPGEARADGAGLGFRFD